MDGETVGSCSHQQSWMIEPLDGWSVLSLSLSLYLSLSLSLAWIFSLQLSQISFYLWMAQIFPERCIPWFLIVQKIFLWLFIFLLCLSWKWVHRISYILFCLCYMSSSHQGEYFHLSCWEKFWEVMTTFRGSLCIYNKIKSVDRKFHIKSLAWKIFLLLNLNLTHSEIKNDPLTTDFQLFLVLFR